MFLGSQNFSLQTRLFKRFKSIDDDIRIDDISHIYIRIFLFNYKKRIIDIKIFRIRVDILKKNFIFLGLVIDWVGEQIFLIGC